MDSKSDTLITVLAEAFVQDSSSANCSVPQAVQRARTQLLGVRPDICEEPEAVTWV